MQQMVYTIRLDLRDTGIVNTSLRLKQGDSGIKIVVNVFNGGVAVFDSSTTPKIVFRRPDGAAVMADMTVESSSYSYTLVGNELQVPGKELIDVKFPLGDTGRESTLSCSIEVVPDTITPNTHGSDIYDNDLAELVAEATAAAETVEEVVGDSEAWAVGERNGVPVGPEDPAYHNNSKWWSEQANVTSLAALTDVDLDTLENGDLLQFDSTTNKWKNSSNVWDSMALNGAYNILPNNATTVTKDGIQFTVYSDGRVLANRVSSSSGTVTLGIGRVPSEFNGKTVKLVGCPAGGSPTSYEFSDNGGVNRDRGEGVIFTANNEYFQIAIRQTEPCNNVLFKPMVTTDLNATYDDYQPHAMTNRELTELTGASASGYGNVVFNKVGREVTVNGFFNIVSDIATATNVMQIPSGYSPIQNMFVMVNRVSDGITRALVTNSSGYIKTGDQTLPTGYWTIAGCWFI